jgi:hypothetical protein
VSILSENIPELVPAELRKQATTIQQLVAQVQGLAATTGMPH